MTFHYLVAATTVSAPVLSTVSENSSGSSSSGSDSSDDSDDEHAAFAMLSDIEREPAEANVSTSQQPVDADSGSVQTALDADEPDLATQDPDPETLWAVGGKNTLKAGQRIT